MTEAGEEIVIVGAGVIGLCTALELLRAGRPVRVLDREAAPPTNCSTGNAGMVVPSHFVPIAAPGMISRGLRWMLDRESPFFVRPRASTALVRWGWLFHRSCRANGMELKQELLRDLNLESRRQFLELAKEDDFGLETRGLLMLCNSEHGLHEEAGVAEQARAMGLRAELLDREQVGRLDPGITMDVVGGVHFADDCHLDPRRFLRALERRIEAAGGVIERGVEVDRLIADGKRITAVQAGARRIGGREFILCGGAWTPRLLAPLGWKLPLEAGKGYSLTLEDPPEMPQVCSILSEAKVAVTPIGRSLRFAGTMEIGGLQRRIDPVRVRGIIKSVKRYFPKIDPAAIEALEPWAGLRPVTPDGLPFLGRLPDFDNLAIGTGHAMMGLSLGPVSGRLLAGLVTGAKPFRPVDQLVPGRFG